MASFRWMSYKDAAAFEAMAREQGVSKKARGAGGFMRVYERLGGDSRAMWAEPVKGGRGGKETWGQKRHNFIKRTLKQYRANPTYRRGLSLIMWAYKPTNPPLPRPAIAGH